ncbi:hypothetical protein IFVP182_C1100070 [Vibrio parahaemolyticus]
MVFVCCKYAIKVSFLHKFVIGDKILFVFKSLEFKLMEGGIGVLLP